jgi:Arc/MetJ-type ribon-helix-helix transcriptional regulator
MKLRVSLPADDGEFLDQFAQSKGFDSRSAVIRKAVRLLRASELGGG